ncbi:hypothetical protein H6G89_13175 [Oscillatoria sp. FACHB-1407]|uniref:hypothetical protein n=1 Tax=Oscillatoria sp. FACHB-1407 TaxID=2692847 RepID=UPI00168A09E6|nr:hypothetical protein [Oscillatoria sp. FACHB-1407]MBD2462000.1 hypothetical protein [Oscillatoria sp. FACHB-1407]
MLEPNPDQTPPTSRSPQTGLTMADVLALPDLERQLVNSMLRSQPPTGMTRAEAIAALNQNNDLEESAIYAAFDRLLQRGFLRPVDTSTEARYRVQLGSMRAQRPQSYWKRLSPDQ